MWDEVLLRARITAAPAASGYLLVLPCPLGPVAGHADQLAEAGVAILLSLVPNEEAASVGLDLAALGRACAARGVGWDQAPILDFAVPDAAFERRWHTLGPALRDELAKGRGVALHCRGGLGRSGTIAARLLIELGLDPAEAIARVRNSRPGAIETRAQEAYLRKLARRSRERVESLPATPEPSGSAAQAGSGEPEQPGYSEAKAHERTAPRR
ncbi:MAG: hypothetical protein NZ555_00695 [Geminicoccaceae bacterium]|nr:hypothetical protein [Geminicoccaceae bacterium]MCX8099741.1 hypothetical protein [Geminicoccaceae bacterium]MDW8369052.1 hypothetical protein [Geminicoccaceae bacterium]